MIKTVTIITCGIISLFTLGFIYGNIDEWERFLFFISIGMVLGIPISILIEKSRILPQTKEGEVKTYKPRRLAFIFAFIWFATNCVFITLAGWDGDGWFIAFMFNN